MLRPAARSRLRDAAATDRTLVERMSRGDEQAFRDLLARYRSTMYATAYAALVDPEQVDATIAEALDRKSTRLNSSHGYISYAVFCLKKKKNNKIIDEKKTDRVTTTHMCNLYDT